MNKTFMKEVEDHERNWGTKSYPKRPSLFEIINAPVVVFWESTEQEEPCTVTLHETLADIEKHFVRMLATGKAETPQKRIAQVFENQEKVIIKGIRILFGKAEED